MTSKANPFEELSQVSDSSSASKTERKAGHRHGAGSSPGLASKITGKAKLARQLAAKQAELTKLQNVTLTSAYHKLGKWVYNSKSGAEALADQFASVKHINSKITEIKNSQHETGEGLKAKAKQVAQASADAAQIKLLQGKLQKAVYQLGKAAFVTEGLQIPDEHSAPIQQTQAKIKTLTKDADELSEKLGTSGWNFKWVYGGVAVVGLVLAGWFVMGAFRSIVQTVSDSAVVDREDIDDVMQSSKQAVSTQPTVARETWTKTDNGPYFEWYANGQLSKSGQMEEGKETGIWIGWHANGEVSFETNWIDGVKQGNELGWHTNGEKSYFATRVDGVETGNEVHWSEKGAVIFERRWSGEESANYRDGFRQGWRLAQLYTRTEGKHEIARASMANSIRENLTEFESGLRSAHEVYQSHKDDRALDLFAGRVDGLRTNMIRLGIAP